MTILSAINYNDFIDMISGGNYLPLTSVSGVGRKTAERLAVELKDKIGKAVETTAVLTGADSRFAALGKASEVIQALIALGYNRLEADKMVKSASSADNFSSLSVEEIIKEVLRGK
jgi:Holliday junction DNA helicase RuvA